MVKKLLKEYLFALSYCVLCDNDNYLFSYIINMLFENYIFATVNKTKLICAEL